jgi:hypothetical protein
MSLKSFGLSGGGLLNKLTNSSDYPTWVRAITNYLQDKDLYWVIDADDEYSKELQELKLEACGDDAAKKAKLQMERLMAEKRVQCILRASVDQSYHPRLDNMENAKGYWEVLQPTASAHAAHELAGQISALTRVDYDTVATYITAAEKMMNELHLTEEGRRLKPEADVVTCVIYGLKSEHFKNF